MYRDYMYSLDSYGFDDDYDYDDYYDDYGMESYYDEYDEYDDYGMESYDYYDDYYAYEGIGDMFSSAKSTLGRIKDRIKSAIAKVLGWLRDKIGGLTAKIKAAISGGSTEDVVNNRAAIEYVKRVKEYNKIVNKEFSSFRGAKSIESFKKIYDKADDKLATVAEKVDDLKEKAKNGRNIYSARTGTALVKELQMMESDLKGLLGSMDGIFAAISSSYDEKIGSQLERENRDAAKKRMSDEERKALRGKSMKEMNAAKYERAAKAYGDKNTSVTSATKLIREHVNKVLEHITSATAVVNAGIKYKESKEDRKSHKNNRKVASRFNDEKYAGVNDKKEDAKETWYMDDGLDLDFIW